MIEGTIRETITETEKIYEYTTVLQSGTRADVTVVRPVLSREEYDRRQKEVEQALIRYVKGVISDGFDWEELVRKSRQNK